MPTEDGKVIRCPFCSAPYRRIVPYDAMQLKCDYCGATFVIPPKVGINILRCQNHPERAAVGKCNDCGGEFCDECLQNFNFSTRDGSAMLYLCPNCLRSRESAKANSLTYAGLGIVVVGIIACFTFWPFGILIVFLGIALAFAGFWSQPKGEIIPVTRSVEEKFANMPEDDWEEADRQYDDLFVKYSEHWGISTGTQLLEEEIRAYTWHGDTWPAAVRKVYRQNQKKQ